MGEQMNTSDSIFKVAVYERVLDVVIINRSEVALEWMQLKFFNFLGNCFHGSGFFSVLCVTYLFFVASHWKVFVFCFFFFT